VNSIPLARLIARESDAIFPGTIETLADDVAAGRLVLLDVGAPALRVQYPMSYLCDRTLSPATRGFIEALRAIDAESGAAEIDAVPALNSHRLRATVDKTPNDAVRPSRRRRSAR